MKINQIVAVVVGVLLMSGCGDQFWCGEDGCVGKKPAVLEHVGFSTSFGSPQHSVYNYICFGTLIGG